LIILLDPSQHHPAFSGPVIAVQPSPKYRTPFQKLITSSRNERFCSKGLTRKPKVVIHQRGHWFARLRIPS
jgi:hypothetical protein